MRIEFSSVADFLGELHAEHRNIYQSLVRFRKEEMPEQDEAVTFAYGVWLTAIVKHPDGEALLECGIATGSGEEGDVKAEEIRSQVAGECKELGLKLRPGKIEAF